MADDLAEIFRREAGPCTASLTRVLGSLELAEDAVAEAFGVAVERWARDGMPPNPGGWIMTTAKRRAIDRLRREATRHQRHVAAHLFSGQRGEHPTDDEGTMAELDALAEAVPDDQLRLMFLCCHPALSADAQVALVLRLLGGLTVAEIARGFLLPEATLAQRLVRAKRKLRDNRAPFRIPSDAELPDRLAPLLASIALVFTEGHRATSGDDLVRHDLTAEAIRLARLLTELMPDEPEPAGLLALLLLTEARQPARIAPDGSMVRLSEQDRSLWRHEMIAEGHELVRACLRRNRPGVFQVQAAIAAVHADADRAEATDWDQIVTLYGQLAALRGDPVVALHRAIAIGERDGAEAGLAWLATIDTDALADYQPHHAAMADLLARAGCRDEARAAYDRALALTTNPTERDFLRQRRAEA